ncbi:MAG: hypothetical protein LBM70_03675 [Victivallales bacterium]|jgi:hypothetical protein|nr:hypothetical protein [Victivallales bacterium]
MGKIKLFIAGAGLGFVILFATTGCEAFKEAWEESFSTETYESTNSEKDAVDDQKKYVISLNAIVKYPRATPNERDIPTPDGGTVWVNTNQLFGSRNIKSAKIVARPGQPDRYDLQLKVDRFGRLQWQLLSGNHSDEPIALIVDGVYFGSFHPDAPENDTTYWVTMRIGIDAVTARGIARNARKNYKSMNPNASSWF